MMRRFSSMKTSPKSLLDFIDVDKEFYGYENEAAVFHDDNENDVEDDVITNISVANGTVQNNDSNNAQQPDSEEGSDIENNDLESTSVVQKKGLKKFFCMPVKSMNPTKKFNRFRISMKKKSNDTLLASDD